MLEYQINVKRATLRSNQYFFQALDQRDLVDWYLKTSSQLFCFRSEKYKYKYKYSGIVHTDGVKAGQMLYLAAGKRINFHEQKRMILHYRKH